MSSGGKRILDFSLASLLRWLAAGWVIVKLTTVIITTVNVRFGGATVMSAAFFDGLMMLVIVGVLIYSLSFLLPQVTNMTTIVNTPISSLLRYAIIAVLGLGILNFILVAAASNLLGGATTTQLFMDDIVWIVIAVVVFYVFSLLIEAKNP
ncbi:MAG: hypothetical protein HN929_10505 [Chloroflexi bacterium]|nr:hypothetical protein [Chloroflexota bacterium]